MTLAQDMEEQRTSISGCYAILFGDLGTRTVFCVAAAPGQKQEDHDKLLAEACRCLGDAGTALTKAAAGLETKQPGFSNLKAIYANAQQTAICLRNPDQSGEVFCAVADTATALPEMTTALTELIIRHAS